MTDVHEATASRERTLPMSVKHTGFMVDRLGHDCAPLQFLRELTQNAIEAILATEDQSGEIVWDVDWNTYTLTDVFKLSITDTGIGMTGPEMVEYINQLSSSVHEQSLHGNFGVGAKIAAATRNHAGLVYASWKDGIGSTIQLWRDPETTDYGLRRMELPGGNYREWGHVEDITKPTKDPAITTHGTKVVLLGTTQNTTRWRHPPVPRPHPGESGATSTPATTGFLRESPSERGRDGRSTGATPTAMSCARSPVRRNTSTPTRHRPASLN